MENGKLDRRVRRTQKLLKEGLAELLGEKEIYKITVQELCDRVDINRATFYAHYTDIFDLYGKIEKDFLDELDAIFFDESLTTVEAFFSRILDFVYENKKFCKMIYSDRKDLYFNNRMKETLEKATIKSWKTDYNFNENDHFALACVKYHVKGMTALVEFWVQSDFTVKREEILSYAVTLNNKMENMIEGLAGK